MRPKQKVGVDGSRLPHFRADIQERSGSIRFTTVHSPDVERMIRKTPEGAMRMFHKLLQLITVILLLLTTSVICAAQEKKKIAYGILLDDTGSTRSQLFTVLEIGKGVVHQVHDHGPVSLFDFASQGVGRAS